MSKKRQQQIFELLSKMGDGTHDIRAGLLVLLWPSGPSSSVMTITASAFSLGGENKGKLGEEEAKVMMAYLAKEAPAVVHAWARRWLGGPKA